MGQKFPPDGVIHPAHYSYENAGGGSRKAPFIGAVSYRLLLVLVGKIYNGRELGFLANNRMVILNALLDNYPRRLFLRQYDCRPILIFWRAKKA